MKTLQQLQTSPEWTLLTPRQLAWLREFVRNQKESPMKDVRYVTNKTRTPQAV